MSAKSRRSRGKHLSHSKRGKVKRGSPPTMAQVSEPVSRPDVSAPSVDVPTPVATLTTVRYPYIATELRRIGIMGGIMLAVLVVLALVLS